MKKVITWIDYRELGNLQQALSDYKASARLGNKKAQDYLREPEIDWY